LTLASCVTRFTIIENEALDIDSHALSPQRSLVKVRKFSLEAPCLSEALAVPFPSETKVPYQIFAALNSSMGLHPAK
jgi:hypothetical protein